MDMQEIKQYNQRVTKVQKEVADLVAEKRIRTQELERLCKELSQEMGRQITPENVEQVYEEMSEQIRETMKSGEEILDRVEQELGQSTSRQQVVGQSTNQPVGQPVGQPVNQSTNIDFDFGMTERPAGQRANGYINNGAVQGKGFNGYEEPLEDGIRASNNLGASMIDFSKINQI